MKKLKLNLEGKMMSKDQMKKVVGSGYGGTCNVSGWVAHNNDWTQYSECSSEAQAIAAMNAHGWSNYCNSSCHTSCCSAQPWFNGC